MNAIEVQHLSKRFRLYHQKYSSVKERILHAGHTPYDDFWALNDIDVAFEAGKTIGILGRNGSGKSTLLKCIAGILQPTSGQVVVRGQIAAMLELGAGMQPELSGRDNIYLNGSLLGLSRRDIDKRFDDIVEFAELEQFIDNQVKYYSSGMYVRLGFAVAVNVDPDILLVDEVLAVGDERFQEKCLNRVFEFQKEGRTIVVVSHAPDLMRQVCEKVLVLDRGIPMAFGPPGEAIRVFRDTLIDAGDSLGAPPETSNEAADDDVEHINVVTTQRVIQLGLPEIYHENMNDRPHIFSGEGLRVRLPYIVTDLIKDAVFSIAVYSSHNDLMFSTPGGATPEGSDLKRGHGAVNFLFDSFPMLDGRFQIAIDVRDGHGKVLGNLEVAAQFDVVNPGRFTGIVSLPLSVELEGPDHPNFTTDPFDTIDPLVATEPA